MSERVEITITPTGPVRYTPATPEQLAAYVERLKTEHGGTGYALHLLSLGEITKEEANRMVREARIRRKLKRRQA